MLGSYPIVINEKEIGKLNVKREGLMTVFEAQCDDPGDLLRISVYGECEGYLGVMIPERDGRLYLHKRLSRVSLAAFPKTIQYVGPSGLKLRTETETYTCVEPVLMDGAENQTKDVDDRPVLKKLPSYPVEIVAEEGPSAPTENCETMPEEADCSSKSREYKNTEIVWRRGAGGALVGTQENMRYLAVPLKNGVAPIGVNFQKRSIDGVDYAVFDIPKGKII